MRPPLLCGRGARASARWHLWAAGESGRPQQETTPSDVGRPRAWRAPTRPNAGARGPRCRTAGLRSAPGAGAAHGPALGRRAKTGHTSPASGERRPHLAHTGAGTAWGLLTAPQLPPARPPGTACAGAGRRAFDKLRGSGRPAVPPVSRAAGQAKRWEPAGSWHRLPRGRPRAPRRARHPLTPTGPGGTGNRSGAPRLRLPWWGAGSLGPAALSPRRGPATPP